MLSRKSKSLSFFVMLAITGCATGKSSKMVGKTALDAGVPTEIAKAYEVSEQPRMAGAAGEMGIAPTVVATPAADSKAESLVKPDDGGKTKKTKSKKGKIASLPKAQAGKDKAGDQPPAAKAPFEIQSRRPAEDPLRVGEKVTFDVSWLRTTAGELALEVLPMKYIEGRKVYHFKGSARSTSIFAKIYSLEDYAETFLDFVGMFPYKFILHGDETKHIRDNLELFDHAHSKQYVVVKDDRRNGDVHNDSGYKDLIPLSQDGLSSMFFVRTLNVNPGQQSKFNVTISGNQSEATIYGDKIEDVRTKVGTFRAHKVRIELLSKDKKDPASAFIWMTADSRKLIVKFEAKVRVGWISGVAKQIDLGHD